MAIAAMPSPRPVRPRPSVVVPDTDDRAADRGRRAPAAPRPAGCRSSGALPITWTAALPTRPALRGEQPAHLGQQRDPARARPLGAAGAEHRADVAEAGGGQQRVAQRVRGDVAVGVAGAAVHAVPAQPGDPALPARLDRVHVGAHPHPHACPLGESDVTSSSASSRSHAVRTAKASGWPATVCTARSRAIASTAVSGADRLGADQLGAHGERGLHARAAPARSGRRARCRRRRPA